jgi:hypothetical protein
MTFQAPRVKYLTNREFLSAIHESKCTFCEFEHKKYSMYDLIVQDLNSVTPAVLQAAREKKLELLKQEERKQNRSKTFESELTLDHVPLNEVVVRVMTYGHIPPNTSIDPAKIKTTADRHMKVNFPPFQHWIWDQDVWRCVGKSHWHKGEFNTTHGRMTDRLGSMFMKLADKYGTRGNWRGYSYVEEMKAQAVVQLAQVGLQFDESRSLNPFSWATQVVYTSFLKVLNTEKKNQSIRDDLLIMSGNSPSHTRQVEDQIQQQNQPDTVVTATTESQDQNSDP